ncbi:hypothetical protein [Chitinophaga sp. LS1]|uniref:hypothetical protein n=1 Tax=Chitinophaga sp. LS1 TaxID=3051176 RepID=UPI002AAAF9B4|nr:hypothetical protein [Chitinophaga sp. LS1]WPV66305.1 hypothetical protein QQL36_31395 [Chitinophaga sp. LS1]
MKRIIDINSAEPGDKIIFAPWKRAYTIKARNERFIICTQPFNFHHTVFYTIIDMERGVMGPNNLVFNMYDYAKQEDIDQCLLDLINPEETVEVSYRKSVALDIVSVYKIKPETATLAGNNE